MLSTGDRRLDAKQQLKGQHQMIQKFDGLEEELVMKYQIISIKKNYILGN